MSSYIIHGENTQASRQKLYEIRNSFGSALINNVSLEGRVSLENQMFSQPRVAIIEFFEKDELRKFDAEKFLSDLKRAGDSLTTVLWFGFELTSSSKVLVESLKNGFTEFKFGVSPAVFKLADCFFSPKGPKSQFFSLLCDFGRDKGDEVFLIQMLIRNASLKLWATYKNNSYHNLSGFSKRQAAFEGRLTKENLLNIFENLVSLERKVKNGPVDLVSNILVLYESF